MCNKKHDKTTHQWCSLIFTGCWFCLVVGLLVFLPCRNVLPGLVLSRFDCTNFVWSSFCLGLILRVVSRILVCMYVHYLSMCLRSYNLRLSYSLDFMRFIVVSFYRWVLSAAVDVARMGAWVLLSDWLCAVCFNDIRIEILIYSFNILVRTSNLFEIENSKRLFCSCIWLCLVIVFSCGCLVVAYLAYLLFLSLSLWICLLVPVVFFLLVYLIGLVSLIVPLVSDFLARLMLICVVWRNPTDFDLLNLI